MAGPADPADLYDDYARSEEEREADLAAVDGALLYASISSMNTGLFQVQVPFVRYLDGYRIELIEK